MSEFKAWVDDPPMGWLSDIGFDWYFKNAPRHYSIGGIEVSKEQFEIAQAATFKSKPLASSCSRKFNTFGQSIEICLRSKGHEGEHSTMAPEPKPTMPVPTSTVDAGVAYAQASIDWAKM